MLEVRRVRNRMRDNVTPVTAWMLRVATTAFGVAAGLAALTVPASAATLAAPSPSSFGLLGPVGLVAVGVGVVGMIAGVARRRRDALSRSVANRSAAADRATADRAARVADEAVTEQYIPGPSQPPAAEKTAPQPAVQGTRAA